MKRWFFAASIIILLLTQYQNCSPSHTSGSNDGFVLSSIYPYYSAKPIYFESLQITDIFNEAGAWRYQLIASIVYIDDPSQDVEYEVEVVDEDSNPLCSVNRGTVNQNSNHIVINDCQSLQKAQQIRIAISAKLASNVSGSLQKVEEHVFDIE